MFRLFAIFVLCLTLVSCASVHHVTAYRCEDVDYARHRLIFHPNGRFAVQMVYLNDKGDVTSRALHAGYYRRSFAAYDLKFDDLPPEKVKKIFAGTLGVFVADGRIYRIEKITANVFVGRCRMRREG